MKKTLCVLLSALLALSLLLTGALAEEEGALLLENDALEVTAQDGDEEVSETEGVLSEAEEEAPVATVCYCNGDELVGTQEVKNGDAFIPPVAPEAPEGQAFDGWYLDGTKLFENEDAPDRATVTADTAYIYVNAAFVEVGEEEADEEGSDDQEPVDQEPVDQEPVEQEPADDSAADQEPVDQEPVEQEPVDQEPANQESVDQEPADQEPADQEPVDQEPQEPSPLGKVDQPQAEPDEVPGDEQPPTDEQSDETQTPADDLPSEEGAATGTEADAPPTDEQQPATDPAPAAQPAPRALTYNGEPQALLSAADGYLYSLDGETYGDQIPAATNAGEYTVFYKTAEDAEPTALTVVIAKADVILTAPTANTEA